jgi:hypothetical protein
MRQSGDWPTDASLDKSALGERLKQSFASIRIDQAKDDIELFLKDPRETSLWSREFFDGLIRQIQIEDDSPSAGGVEA